MSRKFIILRTSESYPTRHIGIDLETAEEILDLLENNPKYRDKYDYISSRILENANMYYEDGYSVVDKSNPGIRITEMRFFPNGDNCRIYCREFSFAGNMFCIIMAKLLPKKKPSGKIDKAIKQIINSIKEYDYELGR